MCVCLCDGVHIVARGLDEQSERMVFSGSSGSRARARCEHAYTPIVVILIKSLINLLCRGSSWAVPHLATRCAVLRIISLRNTISTLMRLEATLSTTRMEILLSKKMEMENSLTNEDLESVLEDILLIKMEMLLIIVEDQSLTNLQLTI